MSDEEKPDYIATSEPASVKAKKDFVIHQNEFHLDIKKGDDLKDVPKRFLQNLKTEQVI